MTNAPTPGNEPEPTSSKETEQAVTTALRRRQRQRIGLFFGVVLLLGVGGSVTWTWIFIHQQLSPLVEKTVTKLLNRPVKLGKVEGFSLSSVRFGYSEVAAIATDPDRASAPAVDATFNPLKLLLHRTLEMDVTFVNPEVYIEQDEKGSWINTKIQALPKGSIDVKLQSLRLQNADVLLVPRSPEGKFEKPVTLKVPSGTARFLKNNQIVRFDLGGQLVSGGKFQIQGANRPATKETKLTLSGTNLVASEIGRLIRLPLLLQAGNLDGNLDVAVKPKVPLQFFGTATLKNVTARSPQLPQPFAKTNGWLRFKGTKVRLDNVTSLFGQIPAQANGELDTQSDFNLAAQTKPVELQQVLQTFKIPKLPVPVSGQVQATLRLTGPLKKPVVTGEFNTTRVAQLDRVNFRTITGGFSVVDSTLAFNNIRATPMVGGLVTARSQVQLGQKSLVFTAEASDVPGDAIAKNYGLKLPITIGSVSGNTQILASLANPNNLRATGSGYLNVDGGRVTARNVELANNRFNAQVEASGVQVERLANVPPQLRGLRGPLSGSFNFSGPLTALSPATIRGNGSGRLNIAGGSVTATNVQLENGRFTARVKASRVPVERVANLPPQFRQLSGPVSGSFNLSGPLTALSPATIRGSGSGSLTVAGGTVTARTVDFANNRFNAQVEATGVPVERVANLPPQFRGLNGPLSGNFNLSGPLTALSPATIRGSGSGSLTVAGGTITARTVDFANNRFNAQVEASGVPVERVANLPPQLRGVSGPVSGNFNLSGSLTALSPATIRGSGSGRLTVAGGTVIARTLDIANGRFNAQVEASGVQVERVANVPPQLRGPVSGNFNLSGSLTALSPAAIRGSGSGSLTVAGGTVTASNVQLENGQFQAVVEPRGVQLAAFSQELRGSVAGRLNVAGSLTAPSPSAIRASGQVNFSQGIALIDRPLTASFVWNGQQQQLQIQQAVANGFNANGVVNVNLANRGLQAIRSLNLNVQARDLNLQQLPAALPAFANLAGRADFDGRIAGTPTTPNVNGSLQLRNLVAGGLRFEPVLAGNVTAVPGQGVRLQLNGAQDRINVALASNYQPVSFDIRAQGAVATGTRQGEQLVVNVAQFPIDILKRLAPVPPAIATQPLSGEITGNLAVNLNTFDVAFNNVALTGPIFLPPKGSQSQPGNNRYLLTGKIARTASGPQFQNVQLKVDQGELQVVVAALEVFDLFKASRKFNTTSGAFVAPVSLANIPLQTQLQRLSEIKALEQQDEQSAAASPLPSLADVKGRFTGTVNVTGSLASGITAQVNIQGENWQWGSPDKANQVSYKVNPVTVIGEASLQNGVLTLLPLRVASGDSWISYSGTIGGNAQSGQLQLHQIPIEQLQLALQKVPNLPPALNGITGFLNATATVSGSISNPQARGEVIIDADTNQTQLERILSSFSYANARLNFGSTIQIAGAAESSSIDGSIPYKLPIASVAPANNKLSLNINVQNQGLTLLNLLSGGLVSWVNGTGNVQLAISGIMNQTTNRPAQLVAQGVATVGNATVGARILPDPLTNVNGKIVFDLDRIQVETLQGQYGGGTVTAAGTIPISQELPQQNPLAVNIGQLAIKLKGLYRGDVQGNVKVTGTALAPRIGGNVELFNGQVQLPNTATGSGGRATGGQIIGSGSGGTGAKTASSNSVEFNDLQLTLGKGVQITKAPILNFLADGRLTINGSLDSLSPEGTIRLKRGEVNLFTTQFRLARGYENTASFTRSQGLDPTLNVRLDATVAEATQRRLPTDPLSAEISDAPTTGLDFGSVRSVRVQARAQGPASQLENNLELTSSPPRSKTEIVALLGGTFVNTLGQGDTTLGLANLAGSAILSNVQNIIGNALGLSEFRLFPTIITSNNEKRTSSSLGLSAEAGVDVGRNLTVSVLKELTTNQPFQYSLSYRLNNEFRVRGITDLSGTNGAILEYESRF